MNFLRSLVVMFGFMGCLTGLNFLNAQPNILIVVADDVGIDPIASYGVGSDPANTPELNSLASNGIRFNNAWTKPACSPTRASILSGKYGNKTGVVSVGNILPLSEVTLFEQVESINPSYAKGAFGKWHIGGTNVNHPNQQGVDHYVGFIGGAVTNYFSWPRVENGSSSTSNEYVTSHITDEAIEWIGNQTGPWLAWVAHGAAHSPFHLPPESLYTRTNTSTTRDQYLCMVESIDHEFGRLYNSLTPEEKENTLVIFIGDNGTPAQVIQGYPSGQTKATVYEGGVRVPMIAAGYGVDRINVTEDAMIGAVDIYATVMELLGNDLPGGIYNSFSFLELLSDSNAPKRPYNFTEYQGTQYAMRNEQYKLLQFANGSTAFYDLLADPLETNNLLPGGLTPEQQDIYDELEAEIDNTVGSNAWSCNDGIQNGDETGIDCGGSCGPCGEEDIEAPSVPGNLTASNTNSTSTQLSWTASTDNVGVTAYRVYVDGNLDGTTASLTYMVTGLNPATTYNIQVTAIDAAGNESNPAATNVTTLSSPDTQAPSPPGNLTAGNTTQVSSQLSWTAATDNVGVTAYRVYVDGNLDGSTAGLNYAVTGLTPATTYNLQVTAVDAAGNESDPAAVNVTTLAAGPPYCEAAGSNASSEWIESISIGAFSNSSGNNGGYANFTGQVISLTAGQAYNLSLAPGFAGTQYPEYWRIWIDFNADGDFSDSGEQVFDSNVPSTAAVNGTINIPATAEGFTRLRVAMRWNTAPQPCGSFNYGEVEDYSVSFSGSSPDTQPPTTPGNLTASNTSTTSTQLSWTASTDNIGVTAYRIYVDGNLNATTAGLNYTLTGLMAATTYNLQVTAVDAAGNESDPAAINVTTLSSPDTQPPSVPGNLTASNTTSTATQLSWTASTDNVGVAAYRIYVDGNLNATTAGLNYTLTGLTPATTYNLQVTAVDAAGNESDPAAVNVTTESGSPVNYCTAVGNNASFEWIQTVAIGAFTNTSGNNGGYADFTAQTINIDAGQSYNLSLSPGYAGTQYPEYWRIWIDFNADGDFTDAGEQVFDSNGASSQTINASLTIPGSAAGSTRLRVAMRWNTAPQPCGSFNYGEVEDYSVSFSGSSPDTQPPTTPGNLTASNTSTTSTQLSWTASTDNVGVTAYRVYVDGNLNGTTAGLNYTLTGLTPATTYNLQVTAVDAAGNESDPAAVNVTTLSSPDTQPPSVPGNLTASNTTAVSTLLSWTASTDNVGVTGYRVYVDGNLDGTTTNLNYPLTGLAPATTYNIQVTAIDAAGNESDPAATNVTTDEASTVYCDAQGNTASEEWIQTVTIGAFTNTSASNGGYADFSGQVINLSANQNYSVSLSPGYAATQYPERWRIWIDFNADGDFTDAGEQVFDSNAPVTGTVNGNINIPAGAQGSTRLRVAMRWNAAPEPCGAFNYGEVEDYTVSFAATAQLAEQTELTTVRNRQVSEAKRPGKGNTNSTSTQIFEGLKLFPNPVKDQLKVQLPENVQLMKVLSVNGTNVLNIHTEGRAGWVDVSGLKAGMYYLIVHTNDQIYIDKFVKQ